MKRGDITHRGGRARARRLPGAAAGRARRDARSTRPRRASRRKPPPTPIGVLPHVETGVDRADARPDLRRAVDRRPRASRCTRSWPSSSRRARRCSARRARSTGRSARRWRSARCCSRAPTSALAGQDTRRGTFSQRHSVLVDYETGAEWAPLAHLDPDQAKFWIYDSLLSEYAALGFEYGYSVANKAALVAWEAQFGDFVNGAQIIIDQYLVAAEDKWGQTSGLVLLLPHGFEGQGPEHSLGAHRALPHAVRPRTTSRSPTPRPRRSTSTCCAARCTATCASRWWCSRRSRCCGRSRRARKVDELDARLVPGGARRPDVRRRSGMRCSGSCSRRARSPTTRSPKRDELGAPVAVRARRAALPVARRAARRGAGAVPERHASSCGCRRSPRTWAPWNFVKGRLYEALGDEYTIQPRQPLRVGQPRRRLARRPRAGAGTRSSTTPSASERHSRLWERKPATGSRLTSAIRRTGKPTAASSSASAMSGSTTLIVVMPMAPRRLEVDAEVVEEHDLVRLDVESPRTPARRSAGRACARRPCSTRSRRRTARRAAGRPSRLAFVHRGDVVGDAAGADLLATALDRLDHSGSEVAAEARQHLAGVDLVTRPPAPRPRSGRRTRRCRSRCARTGPTRCCRGSLRSANV